MIQVFVVLGSNKRAMYKNIKRMDQIRKLLTHYNEHRKVKLTCRLFKISRNTLKRYLSVISDSGYSVHQVLAFSDDNLCQLIYGKTIGLESKQREAFDERVAYFLKELPKVGVTRKFLWESYREDNPSGYGYSQFCERINQALAHRKVSLPLHHNPGEVIQIDFTGKKLKWKHINGQDQFSEVLVFVFPFSQYVFCKAMPSQKIPDFIAGINSALHYFGGLPKVLLSDNLKSYVTKSDRYQPDFNQTCVQLASYYDVELRATRPAHPKDKASVENAVRQCYTQVFAKVQHKQYGSIEQLNTAIIACLNEWNTKDYQKRDGCRKSEFEAYEKNQLRALPSELFGMSNSTFAKVQSNYHVFVGQDKVFYSVPYVYVGQKVQIVYNSSIIQVYCKGKRIAIHKRLTDVKSHHYHTLEAHMPEAHKAYKQQQLMSIHDYMEKIPKQQECILWAIQYMYTHQPSEHQRQQACNKLLSLIRRYSLKRVEQACKRCKTHQHVNCKMIENILKAKLDSAEWLSDTSDEGAIPHHGNIRGAEQYQ